MSKYLIPITAWFKKELEKEQENKPLWVVRQAPCPDCNESDFVPLSREDRYFLKTGRFPCVLHYVDSKEDEQS